jgi:hypothetical protein
VVSIRVRFAGATRPSRLEALEATDSLPVCDRRVERALFHLRVVQVVVHDIRPERFEGNRRIREQFRGIPKGSWHPGSIRDICVALEDRLELEFVLDAVETAGDERRGRQVLVDVAARNSILDPKAGTVTDDAQLPSTYLLYELMLGAKKRLSSRVVAMSPASQCSMSFEKPYLPSPAMTAVPSAPRTLRWM